MDNAARLKKHDDEMMAKDLAFMHNTENWPRWPVLPVKHRRETKVGFLMEVGFASALPAKVFIGNIWEIPEDISKLETVQYESLEALVKDWRVD